MKVRIAIFLTLCVFVVALFMFLKHEAGVAFTRELEELKNAAPEPGGERVPVLVELFTSEGCSSCPPADTLLMQLDQAQPIAGAEVIALSEHVDYWNYLGWADPYSSSLFSHRQEAYSDAFGGDKIYTPQMVVDGQREFVGSRVSEAKETIAKAANAPKAKISFSPFPVIQNGNHTNMTVPITVENLPKLRDGDAAEVYYAITESGLNSSVSKGENAGRKLTHSAVVRKLDFIGMIDSPDKPASFSQTLLIPKDWNPKSTRLVVFVQERKSRRILGAAAIKLGGSGKE